MMVPMLFGAWARSPGRSCSVEVEVEVEVAIEVQLRSAELLLRSNRCSTEVAVDVANEVEEPERRPFESAPAAAGDSSRLAHGQLLQALADPW